MNFKLYFCIILLVLFSILLGCTTLNSSQTDAVNLSDLENKCINLCRITLDKNTDLTNGPCLGLIATDWVCDVAHNPRTQTDNLIENRCIAFANGIAHHFIEVDERCKVIQTN